MKPLVLALCLFFATQAAADSREAAALLNTIRAQAGLAALEPSDKLERVARLHAEDMAKKGYFSHTGADGSRVAQRANRVGYRWCSIAENIAQGQRTLEAAFRDWMASPSHRKNVLSRKVREFGLARGPKDTWVLVLGRDGCWSSRLKGS